MVDAGSLARSPTWSSTSNLLIEKDDLIVSNWTVRGTHTGTAVLRRGRVRRAHRDQRHRNAPHARRQDRRALGRPALPGRRRSHPLNCTTSAIVGCADRHHCAHARSSARGRGVRRARTASATTPRSRSSRSTTRSCRWRWRRATPRTLRLGTAVAIGFAAQPDGARERRLRPAAADGGSFRARPRLAGATAHRAALQRDVVASGGAHARAGAGHPRDLVALGRHRRLRFEGEFYRHTLMTPAFDPGPNPFGPPPVFLGGFGPRMIEVAGEVADGSDRPPVQQPPFARRTGRARARTWSRPGRARRRTRSRSCGCRWW